MAFEASRRSFLGAGLAWPVLGTTATTPPVRYRALGSTGLKVSEVGFGCLITSDPAVLEKAAELGINYFDTARSYQGGNNERLVGAALKGRRKSVLIGTKTHAAGKGEAMAELETSLRELGTDYIDIWYLHSKSRPSQITDELLEALNTAKKQGKVRFAGVSTHSNMTGLIPALAANPEIDVILTSYNYTMGEEMGRAIRQARKAGKAIVAMKVMGGGLWRYLPGKPLREKFQPESKKMLAALKWVLRNPEVDTAIPSMADLDQLEENMRAMSEAFTEEDRRLLAAEAERIRPYYCRACGACEGECPRGLPVPEILRALMYLDGYGQFRLARESYLRLPEQVRALRCSDCAACAVRCPNGVLVAERLQRAQEVFS